MDEVRKLPEIVDWPAFLEAWGRKARARRKKGAPTVVSTFAGCGGSSTGYRMAGFRILLSTDWWETAAKTYRRNWSETPYLVADVTEMNGKDLLEETGVDVGELDLLDGSPPCQGISTAGKRRLDDPRNSLFLDFCRLIEGMQPKTFVMENVGGLVKGAMRGLFREMTVELKACGYRVSCRLLDASWLGVPQVRKRLIWIGVRNDLGVHPVHPLPRYRRVSAIQSLAGLSDVSIDDLVEVPARPSILADFLSPFPVVPAGRHPKIFSGAGGRSGWIEVDKPAPVVIARERPLIGVGDLPCYLSYFRTRKETLESRNGRYMTDCELARLQSFPDWYEFIGGKRDVMTQIGNAVPPLMIAHISLTIGKELLEFPARYVDPDQPGAGGEA